MNFKPRKLKHQALQEPNLTQVMLPVFSYLNNNKLPDPTNRRFLSGRFCYTAAPGIRERVTVSVIVTPITGFCSGMLIACPSVASVPLANVSAYSYCPDLNTILGMTQVSKNLAVVYAVEMLARGVLHEALLHRTRHLIAGGQARASILRTLFRQFARADGSQLVLNRNPRLGLVGRDTLRSPKQSCSLVDVACTSGSVNATIKSNWNTNTKCVVYTAVIDADHTLSRCKPFTPHKHVDTEIDKIYNTDYYRTLPEESYAGLDVERFFK